MSRHPHRYRVTPPGSLCLPDGTRVLAGDLLTGILPFYSLLRELAFCALATFAFAASTAVLAGPPVGTVISNQATGSATSGVTPLGATSNTVSLIVGGGGAGAGFSATLTASQTAVSAPGGTVDFPHILTNTGTSADNYTLATLDLATGFTFASMNIYPDANADGLPDTLVPIAGPIALAPGGFFRFLVRVVVPMGVSLTSEDEVRVSAASAGGAVIAPNVDRVRMFDPAVQPDCSVANKFISQDRGPSPGGPVSLTLTYNACDKARSKVHITDVLPAGMRYVPGSARWSGAPGTVLTDADANDSQGGSTQRIVYDFGVTQPNAVTAIVHNIPAQTGGNVTFQVEIAPGLAVNTAVENIGIYVFYDANGLYGFRRPTNPVTYIVTGTADLELKGDRLPSAAPGRPAVFTNVLTNKGDSADTFDITLSGSTFPAGTVFTLHKPDGVGPLADTDGNGTPDTGAVAAGASINIVVKALIPATATPGTYKVTKTARSARAPGRNASADDIVDTIEELCTVSLSPDNQSLTGFGRHVTYTHTLKNGGNCTDGVVAGATYLGDSAPGWTSQVYIDNPAGGGNSIPGAVDETDIPVVRGWQGQLTPGQSLRVLVDVMAPTEQKARELAKGAKAVVATNVTTLELTSAHSGALIVRDTTILDDAATGTTPQNVIRNFTTDAYQVPTLWAVVGRNAYLRADAASCNASNATVETRQVVITGPNGERETVTATETGAATGVFTVAALSVRLPPVVANDNVLQGRPGDVFDLEVLGCGQAIRGVVTVTDASGVVFDSASNAPVAGASVTLVAASGSTCSATPVARPGFSNPATTGSDGRYRFGPVAEGDYCLVVAPPNGYAFRSQVAWPDLPAGRNLVVSGAKTGGSYGDPFRQADAGGVAVDVPVDPAARSGLFVQKLANRFVVEVGEFVDYAVRVRNGTGSALNQASVILADDLPAGFAYLPGTARRNAAAIADPASRGPRIEIPIGPMTANQEVLVTYRVRVGPGSLQGDGINRVQASYVAGGASTLSNVAAAAVQVVGGVFTERGFILGKVFLDCNANGVQDAGEKGVPGVRVFIEDGTFAITDGGGKYNFYGISNRTHVLKVDRPTLPRGARLAAISSRHLGDGGSRLVDLQSGELHRGDFAVAGCEPEVVKETEKRAEDLQRIADEVSVLAGAALATEIRPPTDVKALPASGVVSVTNGNGTEVPQPGALAGTAGGATPFVNAQPSLASASARPPEPRAAPAAPALPPLESLVPDLDNRVGFIGLKDGETLAHAQSPIRVKGVAGASLQLSVNGAAVPESRIGKRSVLAEREVQAWEYIGVDLKAGENTLLVVQKDAFGNERGRESIRVTAPGGVRQVAIDVPQGTGVADGVTPVKVFIVVTDAAGVPVTARTAVTLEASRGTWQVADLDPLEPGVQVMVEGGKAMFPLVPTLEPGTSTIVAASGRFRAELKVDFVPDLRELVAAGVIEGAINLRNINTRALVPARAQDGFEQELRHLSRTSDDGKTQAGARAAFFLKGKILGEALLTAAYDSDKDTRERLFRDIRPDEFYPVYGDSAVRGYDAQSTSKLYVRIDQGRSWLLWGDYTTLDNAGPRKLSAYSRSLTGARGHWEQGNIVANFFASKDTTRQVIDEIRANGTSGPYQLTTTAGLVNSEKVEILVRDRNQPSIVLSTLPQMRFVDYEMEPFTGRILFRSPVPSLDQNLNPQFVRVTYEVDQGGNEFWVFGGDASMRLHEKFEVGASYAEDRNPAAPFKLAGAYGAWKLGERTGIVIEGARTEHENTVGKGDAARIAFRHDGENLKADVFAARTDPTFDNPGAYLGQGRGEAGARASYKLDDRTMLKAEALRTEDRATGNVREGVLANIERTFENQIVVEAGVRYAREPDGPAIVPPGVDPAVLADVPREVTSVRARVTGPVPGIANANLYGEAEFDVQDADRKVLALGGDYALPNRGKIYFRHEFISSLTGPYGLTNQQRQNATIVGVDTDYMQDGRLFSEYRLHDALSGGDAEAAIGLRNLWTLAPGLRLGTSIERVHAISGSSQNENTAVAVGLEYTANPLWKATTRVELRDSFTSESGLFTLGLAAKLARDWTFLGRGVYSIQRNKGGERDGAEHVIERIQAGVAYRDNETNKVNALGRVEHREEKDDTLPGIALKRATEIISLHADWQPRRPFMLSGHYAAKWTKENSNGLATRYRAQLLSGRAAWEFAPKWDFALVASGLFGENGARSKQYGLGVEMAYLITTNLWVSAGYNWFGYHDDDLAAGEYTNKGPFVRLRYKFDEALLQSAGWGANANAPAAAPGAQP